MQMTKGFFGDLLTWVLDEEVQDKVFRIWFNASGKCNRMFFTQIIDLEHGDYLVGLQPYDEHYPLHRYPRIEYYRLSDIRFTYCEQDQELTEEE